MDARLTRIVLVLAALSSVGATHRTPNFVVDAPTPEIARQVAVAAEHYRVQLAKEWLGQPLRRWHKPCRVQVKVGRVGAGGATTFAFDRGEVFGWRMTIQGPLDRILDSVLPHEVSHTIFACHFRRPLPRWADEGAATLAEDESEQRRQKLLFEQVLKNRRRIPLRTLLSMKNYPRDANNVLTLYAEGFSLADYLVQRGGKARYLKFLNFAHHRGWDRAVAQFYGLSNVEVLDKKWNAWIMAGSPRVDLPAGQQLADAGSVGKRRLSPESVVRSQNPDGPADSRVHGPLDRAEPRGRKLTAPDPRTRKVSQRAASAHNGDTLAESRAHLSVQDKSGKRQASLQEGRRRALNDGWVPLTSSVDLSPEDQTQTARGEQDSRSGRITNWSDFPQRRIGGGSTRLGNASKHSFFP